MQNTKGEKRISPLKSAESSIKGAKSARTGNNPVEVYVNCLFEDCEMGEADRDRKFERCTFRRTSISSPPEPRPPESAWADERHAAWKLILLLMNELIRICVMLIIASVLNGFG